MCMDINIYIEREREAKRSKPQDNSECVIKEESTKWIVVVQVYKIYNKSSKPNVILVLKPSKLWLATNCQILFPSTASHQVFLDLWYCSNNIQIQTTLSTRVWWRYWRIKSLLIDMTMVRGKEKRERLFVWLS